MEHKECNVCGETKPITDFYKSGVYKSTGRVRHRSFCKNCVPWENKLLSNVSSRYAAAKRLDSNIKNIVKSRNNITVKNLRELKEKQNGKCYWLGVDMDFTYKDTLRKPSLDRLDNSKGYEIDNVVLTTVFANTGRRDATTEEMKEFINKYL